MPAAYATGNLTVRPNVMRNKVLYDERNKEATGVEILDTTTKQTEEFYAKVIFKCGNGGYQTILPQPISIVFPNGFGNGSDQVGRNLMDHQRTFYLCNCRRL